MNTEKEITRLSDNVARLWGQVTTGAIFAALNEPTGFPNRTDSALSFVGGTRTFTITPTGAFFKIWQQGVDYDITGADSIIIPDTAGIHAIYYDAGVLTQVANPSHSTYDDLMQNRVLVGLVYWNATDNAAYVLADERHGSIMSGRTHEWIHDAIGAVYREGFTLSGYVEDTDNDAALTFEIEDGEFYDEDIEFDIDDGNPANQYEQQLNGADAELPILYRDDIDGSWTEDAATTLPYKSLGAGRLAYNKDDGDGTFSQVEITDNKFVTMTIIATNDWQYPIKAIQGQNEYTSKQNALEEGSNEILAFGDLLTPETVVLYRIILNTKNTFGGTKKAKIVTEGVVDFRTSDITGASAAAQDHGTLAGLSDDDHAQYLLTDGARDLTGNWTISINNITLSAGTLTARVLTAGDASNLGTLNLYDGTAHKLVVTAQEMAADINFKFPPILDVGKYLKCGAAGVHSWDTPAGGAGTFIGQADTPAAFTFGHVWVNEDQDALEFSNNFNPEVVPGTPDALDDEYEGGGGIDGKWTAVNDPAGAEAFNQTDFEGFLWVRLSELAGASTFDNAVRLYQAAPVGTAVMEYVVRVAISVSTVGYTNNGEFASVGVYLGNSTDDEFLATSLYLHNAAKPHGVTQGFTDAWGAWTNNESQRLDSTELVYLKLSKTTANDYDGANTYRAYYSRNGIIWSEIANQAKTFTTNCDEVGLIYRRPVTDTPDPKVDCIVDFFRRVA